MRPCGRASRAAWSWTSPTGKPAAPLHTHALAAPAACSLLPLLLPASPQRSASLARHARARPPAWPHTALHALSALALPLLLMSARSTRAKKYFLVLMVGGTAALPSAKGLDGEDPDSEEEGERALCRRLAPPSSRGHLERAGLALVAAAARQLPRSPSPVGCPPAPPRTAPHRLPTCARLLPLPPCRPCRPAAEVYVGHRRTKRRKHGHGDKGSKREWIVRKKQQQRARGHTGVKVDSKYTGRKRKDRF